MVSFGIQSPICSAKATHDTNTRPPPSHTARMASRPAFQSTMRNMQAPVARQIVLQAHKPQHQQTPTHWPMTMATECSTDQDAYQAKLREQQPSVVHRRERHSWLRRLFDVTRWTAASREDNAQTIADDTDCKEEVERDARLRQQIISRLPPLHHR